MNVQSTTSLERQVVVRTPENIELTYIVAGAGTRGAAYVLDMWLFFTLMSLLQGFVAALLVLVPEDWEAIGVAILGILSFTLLNVYFIAFELFWGGQTPGKRAVGIRVVKSGGYALRVTDSLMRNLMRAIDFLPFCYGVGLSSLLLTKHCQRVGDMVAGTLVVYQKPQESFLAQGSEFNLESSTIPAIQLSSIPADVLAAVDHYRLAIPDLSPRRRQEFAETLLQLIQRTSSLSPGLRQSPDAFFHEITARAAQSPAGSLLR